jgi:transcriptional regulator with XRE-family HTH domain
MAEIDPKRAQLLGNLIREAREHNGRSPADCAAVLNMSAEEFTAVESGAHPVSLPELEALAIYLHLPMGYFWGRYRLEDAPQTDYQKMIALRQRVIGVLLSQSRLQAGQNHAQIAEATGIDAETLQAYEIGEKPIPYIHLEQIAKALDISIDTFLDDGRGPAGAA